MYDFQTVLNRPEIFSNKIKMPDTEKQTEESRLGKKDLESIILIFICPVIRWLLKYLSQSLNLFLFGLYIRKYEYVNFNKKSYPSFILKEPPALEDSHYYENHQIPHY